jgi:putative membrane protein
VNVQAGARDLRVLLVVWALGLAWSGYAPYDRATWVMEVAPAFIAAIFLWATRGRFTPTTLMMGLILLHGLILMVGGKYTYARVPLGFWMQDWFGLTRNDYDRIGHFAQGFVPAIVARELLIRVFRLESKRLVAFLAVSICLAISAAYELIEWAAALAMGQGADEFLGTQGDPWDTQEDMFTALIGAVAALALLPHWHDRQIAAIEKATMTFAAAN